MRELYGSRGRLRGVELDDETAKIVKSFLIKDYSPKKIPAEAPKKVEVKRCLFGHTKSNDILPRF